jgi:hypothetical protein
MLHPRDQFYKTFCSVITLTNKLDCFSLASSLITSLICGLYYKSFAILIYNRNDCTIAIYDRNDSYHYYKTTIPATASLS